MAPLSPMSCCRSRVQIGCSREFMATIWLVWCLLWPPWGAIALLSPNLSPARVPSCEIYHLKTCASGYLVPIERRQQPPQRVAVDRLPPVRSRLVGRLNSAATSSDEVVISSDGRQEFIEPDCILVADGAEYCMVLDDVPQTASTALDYDNAEGTSAMLTIMGLCFLVAIVSSLDRVAMSVAILPMGYKFGYSESTKGLVSLTTSKCNMSWPCCHASFSTCWLGVE
ncbi:unnamed protein product [Choristocarpus tenellus]